MDKLNRSIFDGDHSVDLNRTLEHVTQQMGRKLNPLEEKIIGRLHDSCAHRLNRRFVMDEENHLLANETDGQAGIVELTEDFACAFKTEAAYAGQVKDIGGKVAAAAGKLYREISVCGSQPLATLLSLSTGVPANAQAQLELQRAVAGMASYHNTYGVPVTGGDVRFSGSEHQDIAANWLAIGLVDREARTVSFCRGAGNPVYLVGAPQAEHPSGAFVTRSLHELICDLHDDNAIVAVQNVDGGGIVGACADMVANGTCGIMLDTATFAEEQKLTEFIPDKVVLILEDGYGKKLEKACRKWNMRCVQVGTVVDEHRLTVVKGETNMADLPASVLSAFYIALTEKDVEASPVADAKSSAEVPVPSEHKDVAQFLMTCPNLLSQQWVFEQFDSTIGANTLSTNFISDAPVLQIKESRHALAAAFCQSDANLAKYPEAANLAVAEALRRTVCSGGTPRAITGCLHYSGNVDDKILSRINEQIALFCQKAGVSSSGINMNCVETAGEPTIRNLSAGSIAFLNDKHLHMTMSFKGKGDMIYMLGKSANNIDSSEYIRNYHHIKDTPPPRFDLDMEAKLLHVARKIIARKLVKSAHNVSKGGLFMALLESAMVRNFGFDITVDGEIRKDAFLFGEAPSRIVVSVATSREAGFIDFMMETQLPFMTLGHITREEIRIDDNSYGFISDYKKKYFGQ